MLNRAATKKFIMEHWKKHRHHEVKRISAEALEYYEVKLRTLIVGDIMSHPSIGKTFNPHPQPKT